MKKTLKLTALILATTFVMVGCGKDKNASLVNTWIPEKIEFKEITFNSQVNPVTQGMIRMFLEEYLNKGAEYFGSFIGDNTVQFLGNGKVVISGDDKSGEGTYTIVNGVLAITFEGETLSGKYTISKNVLYWDINSDLQDALGNLNLDDLENLLADIPFGEMILEGIKGITGITFRMTFNKE